MPIRFILTTAVVLAGCAVASISNLTLARAETECLTTPGAAAPEGRHWYYRSDKATGRRCWYVGEKSKKSRQAKARTSSPRRSADGPAESPVVAAPAVAGPVAPAPVATAAAPTFVETPAQAPVVGAPAVAPPNDVVTRFSQQWPNFARPDSTPEQAQTPASADDAEDTQPAGAPEEQALRDSTAGVRTADEPAAAEVPAALIFNTQRVLVMLIGALFLTGIIMGLVCGLSSIRLRRRIARTWNAGPAPWRSVDEASHNSHRKAEPADTRVVDSRTTDLDRAPQPEMPHMVRAEALRELAKLQELLETRRRRAA